MDMDVDSEGGQAEISDGGIAAASRESGLGLLVGVASSKPSVSQT